MIKLLLISLIKMSLLYNNKNNNYLFLCIAINKRLQTKKYCVSESVSVLTPPPVHWRPDRNIFCVSNVFTRNTIQTSVDREGGVFQMGDVGDKGGTRSSVQKVGFC